MKDVGKSFKEKRESMGVKPREVCEDLDITEAQLENLEDGNINAFKDVFFLKELVRKYSKYLNIDEEETMDKFNKYIFDYTSKIPVKELTQKLKQIKQEEKEERKIISPYTQKVKVNEKVNPIFTYLLLVIIIVSIGVTIFTVVKRDIESQHTISYVQE